jgi:hypothetical protein
MNKLARILVGAAVPVLGCFAAVGFAGPADIQLPPETAQLRPSELAGFVIAAQKCALCHSADYINFQPPGMTLAQWTAEMTKMQHTYGAPIDDTDVKLLGIYLAATYGDANTVSASDRAMIAPSTSAP